MKGEKIFPLEYSLYVEQDDSLDQILIENHLLEEIDVDTFPLVLIGGDTTLIPTVLFKGYGEIGRHSLVSNCFLNRATLKDGIKILDSRIFTGVIGKEAVIINSTLETANLGDRTYVNQSTIINSRLKNEVVVCGTCHIKDSLIDDEVVIQPQVLIDNAKIEKLCYLESGAKIHSAKDAIILKPKVFVGTNSIIEGFVLIDHNSYIDVGVEIVSRERPILIPPFSYVKKGPKGFTICERQALYIIDGLWYISKNQPFSPREVRDLKRKMQLLEKEAAKKQIDIKDILSSKSKKIRNKKPVDLLLEEDGLNKFNNFLQKTIESLVN
jgi:carbonic anhydrase/acetyltransferase-like protein (isoleucine patch superfamily)